VDDGRFRGRILWLRAIDVNDEKKRFLEDKFEPGLPAQDNPAYLLGLIPYEETTTYRKGTRHAPDALVDASGHIELWDETWEVDASAHGVRTLRPEITDLESVETFAREVRRQYPDNLLGFIGGEHSVTPALVRGCCSGDFGVVWIDAHADLRRSYIGRPDNHACAGFNTAPMAPIVQIGVRTLAREEMEYLRSSDRVRAFRRWGDEARRAILDLPRDIYLTVDADGFAPEVIRAVGTPEPGGLNWDEVMEIVELLFRDKNVTAFDTVELCPDEHDIASSFILAKMVYKIFSCHACYKLEKRSK
jgi:agmatinase